MDPSKCLLWIFSIIVLHWCKVVKHYTHLSSHRDTEWKLRYSNLPIWRSHPLNYWLYDCRQRTRILCSEQPMAFGNWPRHIASPLQLKLRPGNESKFVSSLTIFTAIMLPNLPKMYNLTTWTVIFSLIPTQKFSNGEFKLHSMLCNFTGESHF